VDRYGTPTRSPHGPVPTDPDQIKAGKSVDESEESLRMEAECLTNLLVAVHSSLFEEGEKMPGLGVRKDRGRGFRRSHHHTK
jgi:hypothetical protein